MIPRLVIGGAHSGVGKSSVSLAVVAALRQRGLQVQTFKVGPDYLDPGHLARLSGRPCYNLDGWMCDEVYVRQLFLDACADADIAIIEGVMGLFDGSSINSLDGSTAQIASWLQAQVVLVVNAHGMARSVAALVQGYTAFDPAVQIGGVIANMCGSLSHGELLSQALAAAQLPPLLGAIHRADFPTLPSRHLGLVSAEEFDWDSELCNRLSEVAEDRVDLNRLMALVASKDTLVGCPSAVQKVLDENLRIGIARDAAFQFYYPDLFDALKNRGIELCFFSPLCESSVPKGCDALYLGGGYPEVHAEVLSENRSMLQSVADFCQSGRPVYAECGGLIYLSHGVEIDDSRWPLVGVLPSWARMLEKRKALGYIEVTLQRSSLFGDCETRLRGHEFHYSELNSDPVGVDGWQSAYRLRQNRSGNCCDEGYQRGLVLASYAHLHLASKPRALDAFIETIRRVKAEQGNSLHLRKDDV